MRIINISKQPRYFSYSSKAGKTLAPGEGSMNLPLETVFNKLLWKDLSAGNVMLKLSDEDRAFIGSILTEDGKPIPEIKVDAAPTRKDKIAAKAALVKEAREKAAAKAATLKGLKINPGGATGQPLFGPDSSKDTAEPPIPVVIPGQAGKLSLQELKQHNKGVARKIERIERAPAPKGVPMNPRGGIPGQPIFGQGAGPGTGNEGHGKPGPNTMTDAASLLGGRV